MLGMTKRVIIYTPGWFAGQRRAEGGRGRGKNVFQSRCLGADSWVHGGNKGEREREGLSFPFPVSCFTFTSPLALNKMLTSARH